MPIGREYHSLSSTANLNIGATGCFGIGMPGGFEVGMGGGFYRNTQIRTNVHPRSELNLD